MKIIHISDLHLPVNLNPFRLRRKSLVGYANYSLRRRQKHLLHPKLIESIRSQDYNALIISGDITNISQKKEFAEAREILSPILDERVFMVPGNHDRYTQEAMENQYFESEFREFLGSKLPKAENSEYLYQKKIGNLHWFGWDSNLVLPSMQAQGVVSESVVEKTLQFISESKIQEYMIVCHHPLWNPKHRQESVRHRLLNREDLAEKLQSKPPIAYFHGHLHTNWVKLPGERIPFFVINSASSTRVNDERHESGYHLLEKKSSGEWTVKRFSYDREREAYLEMEPKKYTDLD
jgi:3',5'-cyclic AMP phosphodiesterase CpdA